MADSPHVKKWKESFPAEMADDDILKILTSCSFNDLQIGDAIAALWDDQGKAETPPEPEWEAKTSKKERKKKAPQQPKQPPPTLSNRRSRDGGKWSDSANSVAGRGRGGGGNRNPAAHSRYVFARELMPPYIQYMR